jgi:hypothetical protein
MIPIEKGLSFERIVQSSQIYKTGFGGIGFASISA